MVATIHERVVRRKRPQVIFFELSIRTTDKSNGVKSPIQIALIKLRLRCCIR